MRAAGLRAGAGQPGATERLGADHGADEEAHRHLVGAGTRIALSVTWAGRILFRLAAEMSKIGVERLTARRGKEHGTQCQKTGRAVIFQKGETMQRVKCC